jgi:hypothetical protein
MHVIPEAPVETAAVAPTPDAAIPEAAPTTPVSSAAVRLEIGALLRPHWKSLLFAVLAVVGETAADIAEPWPVKIVVDNLLQPSGCRSGRCQSSRRWATTRLRS